MTLSETISTIYAAMQIAHPSCADMVTAYIVHMICDDDWEVGCA